MADAERQAVGGKAQRTESLADPRPHGAVDLVVGADVAQEGDLDGPHLDQPRARDGGTFGSLGEPRLAAMVAQPAGVLALPPLARRGSEVAPEGSREDLVRGEAVVERDLEDGRARRSSSCGGGPLQAESLDVARGVSPVASRMRRCSVDSDMPEVAR